MSVFFSGSLVSVFFFISFNIYFTFGYQVKLEGAIQIDIANGITYIKVIR